MVFKKSNYYSLFLSIFLAIPDMLFTQNFYLSGGVDTRYRSISNNSDKLILNGIFLNLRKVLKDSYGDRFIIAGQVDFDDNFREIRPYQTYLHYKGPMGKFNIKLGHFILPFGLLVRYDTERLLLQSMEFVNIGIKLDTGVGLFGFIKDYDWAISITNGTGGNRLVDVDKDKVIATRFGYSKDDMSVGFSFLLGKVFIGRKSIIYKDVLHYTIYEKRVALDFTRFFGPLTVNSEVIAGMDDSIIVGGTGLFVDYAFNPKLEFNFKYSYFKRGGERNFLGAGITYQILKGLYFRVADEYEFGKENKNVASIQIYFEWFRHF